jgi:hypothetical protein
LCVYATGTEEVETVKASMREFGLKPNEYVEEDNSLLIVGGGLYGSLEEPNIERFLHSMYSVYETSIRM